MTSIFDLLWEWGRLRVFFVCLIVIPTIAFGTAQVEEVLIWEGEELPLASVPLDQFELPDDWEPKSISSACWRGYRGYWEIRDDRLYLLRLLECHGDESIWTELLPDKEAPLLADWYSGVLRIPRGERLEYVHMGFASVHEKDLYLVLVDGVLVGRFEVANDFNALSYYDRQRAELGDLDSADGVEISALPAIDGDEWLDAMLLRQELSDWDGSSEIALTVRGLYFSEQLFLPGNGAVPAWELRGELGDDVAEPETASAVEARLTISGDGGFVMRSFRRLEEGEPLDRRGKVKAVRWTRSAA